MPSAPNKRPVWDGLYTGLHRVPRTDHDVKGGQLYS